ncbi:MAG: helix-turn-helix domain-containing protein [Actinophytocola sp.]|uniref:helix-turn-helix transcriptional regulator n=1 Tax=Actinophytocola sp. TaxID=1872138 RepID=UPI001321F46E|nr:helix-turn-helix domain-containing protein [Actinophytocola sp.]MPZ78897.1 helix-turn-helix domain-containing protein [Actinophytocola sp.]
MEETLASRVAAVAALDEPTRRLLYEHVVRQPAPVSRDEVAAALRVPRATVAFHLDRLVEQTLLDVTYQRRTGRSGPGAGRPAKLYSRSRHHVAVSLPERRYDLSGHLLAAAVEEADRTAQPVRAILGRRAHELGLELGRTRAAEDDEPTAEGVLGALEAHGFEPRTDGDRILLGNCPFHALAQEHTQLVCGMNLSLLTGLLHGLGHTGLTAHLDPAPGRCCVLLEPDRGSD